MKSSISTLAIILTLVILSSYSCKKEELENEDGNEIAECNYAWRQVDEMCGELENCETIYRVKDNIWGQPAVDKYGLRKL